LAESLLRRLETEGEPAVLRALQACRRICRESEVPLYIVGGTVRDLVLGRQGYDLDLTLEGDVAPVAEALAKTTGGRAVLHDRFGTATVSGPDFSFDLVRARRESYPHHGSLPVVEPATLTEDLRRRDFTINAIALRLWPEPVEVINPFRGVADVRSSLVRVLHDRSFQDDATRMLRAVRYACRLEFKIATQTAALIRRDLESLKTISGPRLRRELSLLFQEASAVKGARLAQELGVLQAIHPALGLTTEVAARWQATIDGPNLASREELGFCVVANPKDEGAAASVSQWLYLEGRIERALNDLVRLRSQSPKLASMLDTPSQATELLDGFAPSAVWAESVLAGGDTASVCLSYLTAWRHVRPELTGTDLLALGVSQGAGMGETLRRLRAAKLDGRISTREDEIALVRGLS
jgi:tRNA nucleotidyltransferase (CCA-adding enzyme)